MCSSVTMRRHDRGRTRRKATPNNRQVNRYTIFMARSRQSVAMTVVKRHPPEAARPDAPLANAQEQPLRVRRGKANPSCWGEGSPSTPFPRPATQGVDGGPTPTMTSRRSSGSIAAAAALMQVLQQSVGCWGRRDPGKFLLARSLARLTTENTKHHEGARRVLTSPMTKRRRPSFRPMVCKFISRPAGVWLILQSDHWFGNRGAIATLEPGLLESVYAECLSDELGQAGIPFQQEVTVPVI
jgi:hypothetical protein